MKRSLIKRSQPRRDWTAAREKVEAEGACRVCGNPNVEAAHVIGREHDAIALTPGTPARVVRLVHPEAVVPLCREHHRAYDAHELDLLPYLTGPTGLEEQCRAVKDAGGLVAAYERTTGNRWRAEAA